jgi:uncharacterized protein (TIGR02246 family)
LALGLSLSGCATDEHMDRAKTLDQDEALVELRQKMVQAYQSGEASQLAQLFTDDGVLIPSAGQEIKGRQNIEQTFRTLWQNWKVVDFNLVPQESKTTGEWAFERGTIALQVAKADGAQQTPAAARKQNQAQARGDQTGSGGSVDQVFMDLNYYVMVLNKVNNDWRISWFVSTNPPEYVDTVTSDQDRNTATPNRQRGTPSRSERSAE